MTSKETSGGATADEQAAPCAGLGGWHGFRADLARYQAYEPGHSALYLMLLNQGLWALLQYRSARGIYDGGLPSLLKKPLLMLCVLWQKVIEVLTGIELPYRAQIAPGLYIGHCGHIILHPDTRIGAGCNLSQGVTLGISGRGRHRGVPALGARVYVGANAVIAGKLSVGDDALIAANALVTRDVAPRAVMLGNPAKPVSFAGSGAYLAPDGEELSAALATPMTPPPPGQPQDNVPTRRLPQGNAGAWVIATRGRTSGFDYLRITLACLVILSHSRIVTYGIAAMQPAAAAQSHPALFQPILWSIVPSFFILSGFLVAGSLVRAQSIFEFGMLRALRIVPALFVETVIAALILGPLVTDLPLRAYFSGATLWTYPLNIIGDIHYLLPGVFTHNPAPNIVNVQLWTIPVELLCYATLVAVYLLVSWISRAWHVSLKSGIGLLTLGTLAILLASTLFTQQLPRTWHAGASTVLPNTLLLSFLIGVTAYFYRERIPLRFGLFLAALVAAFIGMYDGGWQYLGVIPLAYVTIYLGLTNFPKTLLTATGDYSYGIYLYGYPVQQSFAYLFPHNRFWELNFAVSLAVSMLIAALSWHFIESRVLAHRKAIIAAVQNILRFAPVPKWR